MSAPAPPAPSHLDGTFWDALPGGHRVALFAAPFAIAGALGPVLRGTTVTAMFGGPPRVVTLHGFQGAGPIGIAAAVAALLVLLLVKDRQKRSARAMVLFLLAAAWPVFVILSNGFVLNGTANAGELQWGPPVAIVASLVGFGGALAGSRDPSGKPTY